MNINNSDKFKIKEEYTVKKIIDVKFPHRIEKGRSLPERSETSLFLFLKFDWPDAAIVAGNFCRYMSDAIRVGDVPLASKIISSALETYSTVTFRDDGQKCEDQARVAYFIEGLLDAASDVKIEISDAEGKIWSLGSDHPFDQWLSSTKGELSVKVDRYSAEEKSRVRNFIYDLITPSRIKGVLAWREYDKALVRGCLASVV